MQIASRIDLEECAVKYGVLPFFRNNIPGFSVEEMTAPGMLFGGNEYEGCWEWKGPVIRTRTTAYGKFFRRKAGFVSRELLPYFLKFRHDGFPVAPDSMDEMIYEIIALNDRMTSTELRLILNGSQRKRRAFDLPELERPIVGSDADESDRITFKKSQIEAPLQRLQMAGKICISDFRYKQTAKGERYGWGVAEYATPETLFHDMDLCTPLSAKESLDFIIDTVGTRFRKATSSQLLKLLS